MNVQLLRALASGLLFGLWPIYMQKSNLPGYVATAVLCGLVFVFVLPFLLATQGRHTGELMLPPDWEAVITAAILAAMGMIYFNDMLSIAAPQEVGTLIIFTFIMQISMPVAYDICANQGLSAVKAAGLVLAMISIVLVNQG